VVEEAHLEATEYGLAPATEGWFVVNVREVPPGRAARTEDCVLSQARSQ
jgi:hypothetical protein